MDLWEGERVECSECNAPLASQASFCAQCGAAVAVAARAGASQAGRSDGTTERIVESGWTCETCSWRCAAGSEFCGRCGSHRPAHAAPARYCGSCGTQMPEADAFCGSCGTPVAPLTAPQTAVAPAPPPPPARRSNTGQLAAIAGAATLLIAITVVVVLLLTRDDGTSVAGPPEGTSTTTTGSTTATIADDAAVAALRTASADLARLQSGVNGNLRQISLTRPRLERLRNAADDLSQELASASGAIGAGSGDDIAGAAEAIRAHERFADAILALPSNPAQVKVRAAREIQDAAADARAAWRAVEAPGIAQIPVGQAFVLRLVERAEDAARERSSQAQLGGYLRRFDGILDLSSSGRGNVGSIVTRVQRNQMSPDEGQMQMSGPISNRQTVLAQISSLPAAPANASDIAALLQEAINASLQADLAYRTWMASLPFDYDYAFFGDQDNAEFQRARSWDSRASTAKAAFTARYNMLARQAGLREWSPTSI